jgi:DNA-binding response OmpR family regulator
MLQGRDCLSVFRVLRAVRNSTPTLLFTARVKVSERVAGLEPGTNDYVVKPFNMRELVARINGLARVGRSRRLAFCSGDPWFENLRRELSLDTMRHASSASSIVSYFRS